MFEKWERDQQVTLKRNDTYWGDKAKVEKVIIRTISDPKARTQELQAGNIDGYDLVGPADVQPLKDAGFQIQNRPAFNILYLGINQKNKALQNVKVRQAIGLRDRQGGRGEVVAARGIGARQGVHAQPGGGLQRLDRGSGVRRRGGQEAPQGGRPGEPGAQVRLPDGCLPAVHAVTRRTPSR